MERWRRTILKKGCREKRGRGERDKRGRKGPFSTLFACINCSCTPHTAYPLPPVPFHLPLAHGCDPQRFLLNGANTSFGALIDNSYDAMRCTQTVIHPDWTPRVALNDLAMCIMDRSSRFQPVELDTGGNMMCVCVYTVCRLCVCKCHLRALYTRSCKQQWYMQAPRAACDCLPSSLLA